MKPSSPLLPPDSFLGRPTKRGQPNMKLMVFVVLAIHVIVIGGLLFQGCHHKAEAESAISPVVTNAASIAPTASSSNSVPAKTNPAVAPEPARSPVRAASLLEANPGLSATYLRVGQVIHVPTNSEAVAHDFARKAGAASEEIYVITSGDTLEKIAKAHGTTVKNLQRLNNLNSDRVVVGKQLKIPSQPRKETETPPPANQ